MPEEQRAVEGVEPPHLPVILCNDAIQPWNEEYGDKHCPAETHADNNDRNLSVCESDFIRAGFQTRRMTTKDAVIPKYTGTIKSLFMAGFFFLFFEEVRQIL